MKIIQKKVSELGPCFRQLLGEVATIAGRDLQEFEERMALHCLVECLYSNGASEPPIPFTKEDADSSDLDQPSMLGQKVGKFLDDEFHQALRELADMPPAESIERYTTTVLYSFLNKRLIKKKRRAKPIRFF